MVAQQNFFKGNVSVKVCKSNQQSLLPTRVHLLAIRGSNSVLGFSHLSIPATFRYRWATETNKHLHFHLDSSEPVSWMVTAVTIALLQHGTSRNPGFNRENMSTLFFFFSQRIPTLSCQCSSALCMLIGQPSENRDLWRRRRAESTPTFFINAALNERTVNPQSDLLPCCCKKGSTWSKWFHYQGQVVFHRSVALSGSLRLSPSIPSSLPTADIPASTMGGLQGHADGLRLLQQLQHHGLQDRLRDEIPGGELQLQDGPYAW